MVGGTMITQKSFSIETHGRSFTALTGKVADIVDSGRAATGMCHVFVRHTSASLLITENADPAVRRDLERFMQRVVPDGSPDYEHDAEGPDDMPGHIRSALTSATVSVPVSEGRLLLGTWQGIYLWEHRIEPQTREIVVTVIGADR
jgi:secondary thiamine-phosphate synthase enzyme